MNQYGGANPLWPRRIPVARHVPEWTVPKSLLMRNCPTFELA